MPTKGPESLKQIQIRLNFSKASNDLSRTCRRRKAQMGFQCMTACMQPVQHQRFVQHRRFARNISFVLIYLSVSFVIGVDISSSSMCFVLAGSAVCPIYPLGGLSAGVYLVLGHCMQLSCCWFLFLCCVNGCRQSCWYLVQWHWGSRRRM